MKADILLNRIEGDFNISKAEMRRIIKDFHGEMEKGLAEDTSSLRMLPAYTDRPTGKEKGRYIALDVGGTNFRILEVALKGNGRMSLTKVKSLVLDKRHITGSGKLLFDFLAGCISDFVADEKETKIGFTFSFPMDQTGIASGRLLVWTKGFNVKGVIGKDIVKLLEEALIRKGAGNIKVAALANDTVSTLIAKSYEDRNCDIGIILGTGTNSCYIEELSNIKRLRLTEGASGRMIINIEWGNFNKLKRTSYDKRLDGESDNKGKQILEKMVSGMYLGELTRLVLKDFMHFKAFHKKGYFKTEYASSIESDRSPDLTGVDRLLKRLGIRHATLDERKTVQKICKLVSRRGARIIASCIAAIITKKDRNITRPHTLAIDGSVYERHPYFSKHIGSALKEIFGPKSSRIKAVLAKDGSGKGAAIIAAVV